MNSLKLLCAAAALCLSTLSVVAQDHLKFIFVSHGQANDSFHSIVKNGAAKAAEDLGVELDYRSPETFDVVAMAQLIDAAVNQEPAGLIVTIPDAAALGPSIQRAREAGIPVVSNNNGGDVAADVGSMVHIGQDDYAAGKAAGERLKELGGTKGICVHVEPGNVGLDRRCQGFTDGFGQVTVLSTSLDVAENVSKIRAALEADPAIDTVLGTSAPHAGESAVKAVDELGRTGQVHVATFDLSPGMLEAIEQGKADFALDQQQYIYGYLSVTLLKLYNETGIMPIGLIQSGPNFVTKENASQVVALSQKGIR